jgi:hypothetical protein
MATGERSRSGGARGIAHFLSEHEDHGGGFDVQREPGEGTGRLTVTCGGCGEAIEYQAAEVDPRELAATEAEGLDGWGPIPPAEPAAAPSAPRPAPPRRRPPQPERRGKRTRRASGSSRWLATGAIALLIVGGLVMILVGVMRDNGGSQSAAPGTQQAPAQTSTGTKSAPTPSGGGTSGLQRKTFANRFSIGVAPGWQTGQKQGATALTAPGGVAEVDVYFQKGENSSNAMAKAASSFLERRHPDGQAGKPQTVQFAGSSAVRVAMTYSGGEEIAVVLPHGGYTYAVLTRVDKGANQAIQSQAQQQANSFRVV